MADAENMSVTGHRYQSRSLRLPIKSMSVPNTRPLYCVPDSVSQLLNLNTPTTGQAPESRTAIWNDTHGTYYISCTDNTQ
jgi:hypothetical protein